MIERVLRRLVRRWEAMTCREAVAPMTDYLEGALEPVQRARFERHLARCAACNAYLGQMQATVDALGHLPVRTLPRAVRDELVDVYRRYYGG